MNLLIAILSLAASLQAEPIWLEAHAQALARAKAENRPMLIEFQAPWCYSCYYMAANVLSKEGFAAASRSLVLLKEDVDKEEGMALKAKYLVTALPSFVVVSPKGEVLGRIAGEQTEADFLARLSGILKASAPDPLAEAESSLEQRLLAGEKDKAAALVSKQTAARLKELRARRRWRVLEARLELARASGEKAAGALNTLMQEEDGCDAAYDVMHASKLLESLPEARRRALYEAEQRNLESLMVRRLFVPAPQRCADFRSGVEVLAETYSKLGLKEREAALLKRAAAFLAGMGVKTGTDRNHDDDRRFFMELSDDPGLRAFFGDLTSAYPSDYVYPYRYAKYLLGKGEEAAALERAEAADKLAYGANRLSVTKVRAKALAALGRKAEAEALLKRDIKAGKAFPDAVKSLNEALAELGAKKS